MSIKSEERGKDGVKNGVKKTNELSENEILIMELLKKNPKMTTKVLSETTDFPTRTIQRYLSVFKENGLLIREGSKTNGKWYS